MTIPTKLEMENRICSYPKIYALGHRQIVDLLADPVVIEEKVDGSQFSFGKINGELMCRSKGKQLMLDAPEKMFSKAVEQVREMEPYLKDNVIYRGEYLQKPKHNTLSYSRVPHRSIILFDMDDGNETYALPSAKVKEGERLGLECVPLLFVGVLESMDIFTELLERESILGGTKIEGIVIKNYHRFGQDKKALMGKYVSEAFKEKHEKEWKTKNPGGKDIKDQLIQELRCEGRWAKAVQHLKEEGKLTNSPKDIGMLIKEVQADIESEEKEMIKDRLYKWAIKDVLRGASGGVAQWYKDKLAEKQFGGGE